MDIDSLISEIFVRPSLWDQKDKNHHNRFVLDKLWDEVAIKLNTTRKYKLWFLFRKVIIIVIIVLIGNVMKKK